ncbi:MAG TPA: hypothetical protein VLG71_01935 [Candidatus Limnocylindria bacterium]|nr:hypothetical protein [Candidatus Limnocylindria bacterium]
MKKTFFIAGIVIFVAPTMHGALLAPVPGAVHRMDVANHISNAANKENRALAANAANRVGRRPEGEIVVKPITNKAVLARLAQLAQKKNMDSKVVSSRIEEDSATYYDFERGECAKRTIFKELFCNAQGQVIREMLLPAGPGFVERLGRELYVYRFDPTQIRQSQRDPAVQEIAYMRTCVATGQRLIDAWIELDETVQQRIDRELKMQNSVQGEESHLVEDDFLDDPAVTNDQLAQAKQSAPH